MTPPKTPASDDGERLARIETKIDQLCHLAETMSDYPAVRQQVETNKDEINRLRNEQRWWGVGNGLAAVIAAVIGVKVQ